MFLRLVYVLHVTWLVNSASHMWGYRNYQTSDDSRNLWWVGLLAFGEGWHNNHHAFPGRAAHGHRWWEIDVTYLAILAMEKVGLAWKVIRERTNRSLAASLACPSGGMTHADTALRPPAHGSSFAAWAICDAGFSGNRPRPA